jgi:hypothetical protein
VHTGVTEVVAGFVQGTPPEPAEITPPSAPAEEEALVTPPPSPPEPITSPEVEPVTSPKLMEKPVPAKPPPAPKSMRAKKPPPPKLRQHKPASPGVTEMAAAGESRPGPRVPLPEAGKEDAGGNVVGPPADVKLAEQPPTAVEGGEAGAGNLFERGDVGVVPGSGVAGGARGCGEPPAGQPS